jgi:hypothetical protein
MIHCQKNIKKAQIRTTQPSLFSYFGDFYVTHKQTYKQTHPVELPSMSDNLFAQAATYTRKTLTTDIHALNGIRTHDHNNRVAADLHLRRRSHRD